MTDRELLEKAAKAASMEPGSWFDGWNDEGRETGFYWNPLTDDGDAFRLAVQLGIHATNSATYAWASHLAVAAVETLGADRFAATRRAIVRAAAALADQEAHHG